MGYKKSLEATGVKVKEYKEFGSYQGTWIAILSDDIFIEGSYGSCSGCDAFEAEFDYLDEEREDYQERLKDFGMSYINSSETYKQILERYKVKTEKEYAWDDDKEIYDWLLSVKPDKKE